MANNDIRKLTRFDYEPFENGEWKYRLRVQYGYVLPTCFEGAYAEFPAEGDPYLRLVNQCVMMRKGYAWNGANYFPDFEWVLRATLVHDSLCQLVKEGVIDSHLRKCADRELYCIVTEDKACVGRP